MVARRPSPSCSLTCGPAWDRDTAGARVVHAVGNTPSWPTDCKAIFGRWTWTYSAMPGAKLTTPSPGPGADSSAEDPGYKRTAPVRAAPRWVLLESSLQVDTNTSVLDSTTTVGYRPVIRGRIVRDGEQLTLVIGVAANDPILRWRSPTLLPDQLRIAGQTRTVGVRPVTPLSRRAERQSGRRHCGLAPPVVNPADAAGLSLWLSLALQATTVPAANAPTTAPSAPIGPTPSAAPDTATPPPTVPRHPGALAKAPSNLTGTPCDRSIQ